MKAKLSTNTAKGAGLHQLLLRVQEYELVPFADIGMRTELRLTTGVSFDLTSPPTNFSH